MRPVYRSLPVGGFLFGETQGDPMLFENAAQEDLLFDDYGRGVISTSQEIGDDYWEDVKEAQENFQFRLNGLTSVASIPESVVNTWLREGFDFWNASAQEILNKLRKDEYSRFILSGNKTF